MQFRFFSVVLVMLVALVLVGGASPAQAAPFVERINSWTVTRIDNDTNCAFPYIGRDILIYTNFNATWTPYNSHPPDTIDIGVYDALGNSIGRPMRLVVDPTINQGGGTADLEIEILILGTSPTPHPRPWRLVAFDDRGAGEQLGTLIVDPADFGVCANAPYLGIATGTDSEPIIDTSSQNTAVFDNVDDDGNPSLDVYGINDEGEGYYIFTITQDDLAPFIDNPPAENTEIESVGNVTLYVLDTGEFQLNIGPDEEGKVRVVIFNGLPVTTVYSYDFNVYDILEPDAN